MFEFTENEMLETAADCGARLVAGPGGIKYVRMSPAQLLRYTTRVLALFEMAQGNEKPATQDGRVLRCD